LHYFTSSLNVFDERTKFHFVKLIDDYIQEEVNKKKYEAESILKEPKIKALKKLKKIMLMNKGDKKVFNREIQLPSKEHIKKYTEVEKSMKAFPRKKDALFEKYMQNIDKAVVKRKPQSPQISAISTHNNCYTNTLSTNTYYNTLMFNPIYTEKITRPNTYTDVNTNGNLNGNNNEMSTKEKENINFYHNTKTSFFSLAVTNPKTITSGNNNDDLSFSKNYF